MGKRQKALDNLQHAKRQKVKGAYDGEFSYEWKRIEYFFEWFDPEGCYRGVLEDIKTGPYPLHHLNVPLTLLVRPLLKTQEHLFR